jgi:hypothetical protein
VWFSIMISMTCLIGEPGTAGPAAFGPAVFTAADVMAAVATTRDTSPAARNFLLFTLVIVSRRSAG